MPAPSRSPSPSVSEADDVHFHEALDLANLRASTTSKGRTPIQKIWVTLGKTGARSSQMYGAAYDATMAYMAVNNAPEDPLMHTEVDKEKQARNDLFVEWLCIESPLFKMLYETGNHPSLQAVCKLIEEGRTEARNDDAKTLRAFVSDESFGIELDPPVKAKDKSDRGFHHPQFGRMLCPCGLDWDSEAVQVNFKTPGAVVPSKQFPLLLYRDLEYDAEDIEKGLFENEQLIRAFYKIIVLSQREKTLTLEEKIERGMTFQSVSYTATLTRLAVSSDARIDTSPFSYNEFYTFLVKTLRKDEAFWRRLRRYYKKAIIRIYDGGDEEEDDLLSTLDKQRMIKRRAAEKSKQVIKPRPANLSGSSTSTPRITNLCPSEVENGHRAAKSTFTPTAPTPVQTQKRPADAEVDHSNTVTPKRAKVLADATNTKTANTKAAENRKNSNAAKPVAVPPLTRSRKNKQ